MESQGRGKLNQIQACESAHYLSVDELRFHPENANLRGITRQRLDDLKASIMEKGIYQPFIVWKEKNFILSGNHRLKAVQELLDEGFEFQSAKGLNMMPVILADVSEERASQILHEANGQYAEWIEESLAKALLAARDAGEELKQYGYSDKAIEKMLASASKEAEDVLRGLEAQQVDVNKELASVQGGPKAQDLRFESIMLPEDVYHDFMEICGSIAKKVNSDWREGDSIVEAVQVLILLVRQTDVVESLGGSKAGSKKAKESEEH
jgi:hypothetical protein